MLRAIAIIAYGCGGPPGHGCRRVAVTRLSPQRFESAPSQRMLTGGAAGFLLTLWGTDLLLSLLSPSLDGNTTAPDVSPDASVFLYTLLISLLTGVVFGLVPALQASKPDVLSALKDEAVMLGGKGRRALTLRNVLVVSQVAVSLRDAALIKILEDRHRVLPSHAPVLAHLAHLRSGMLLKIRHEALPERFHRVARDRQLRRQS